MQQTDVIDAQNDTRRPKMRHYLARSTDGWDVSRTMCGITVDSSMKNIDWSRTSVCDCVVCHDIWRSTGGHL